MANDNEWIEWNGGECPVPPDTTVDIKLRIGQIHSGIDAIDLDWQHFNNDFYSRSDIVAYRVSK